MFFVERLEAVLIRKPNKRMCDLIVDGDAAAHLIALSCRKPQEAQGKWTLQLRVDKAVEL
ncbi:MAG: hypothetical protein ACTXOO_04450 [Sodalis sp. (in: enterobacteria)]